MAERVLIRQPDAESRRVVLERSPEAAWRLVAMAGLFLGAAGWLDILLLWLPPHFGRAEWEFGTASATFDALPLATIGLALLLAGALAEGWKVRLRAAGWFALLVFLLLSAVLVLFLLDVPLAWQGVPPASLSVLKKAIAKTLVLALAYLVIYGVFGVTVLRRLRAVRTLRGQGA